MFFMPFLMQNILCAIYFWITLIALIEGFVYFLNCYTYTHATRYLLQEQFGDKPSERHPARSDLIVLVAHNDDPTDQMFVFFPDEAKVCINSLKLFCEPVFLTIIKNL